MGCGLFGQVIRFWQMYEDILSYSDLFAILLLLAVLFLALALCDFELDLEALPFC